MISIGDLDFDFMWVGHSLRLRSGQALSDAFVVDLRVEILFLRQPRLSRCKNSGAKVKIKVKGVGQSLP